MAKWSDTMNVPIVHGVGGSFDVMSGKVSRASTLWQKLGLEWLYRVKQEPRRLWKRYLVTNTWFCWLLFKAALQQTLWTLTSSDKLPSA
jgi:N-acetylglucosaminyldiphosphoundecaprenol N-acetyl-beta-D-mannosaminyltransferase